MKTTRARRTKQERAEIRREYYRLVAPRDQRFDLSYDLMEEIVSMIRMNRILAGGLADE